MESQSLICFVFWLIFKIYNLLKVDGSINEILQILSISLLDKTLIREILINCDYKYFKEPETKQLKICGF